MITSLRNPRVAAAKKLRRSRARREAGRTTIEGPFVLEEALRAGVAICDVFCLEDDQPGQQLCSTHGVDVQLVAPHVLGALAETTHPRGPVAVIETPEAGPVQPIDSVVLWGIGDPGNAGTIIRTAAAFGFQVLATADTVDLWSPKVLRSAVGAHFRVGPIVGLAPDPAALLSLGLRPVATAAGGETPLEVVVGDDGPQAFLVGNEAHGIPAVVCDHPVITTTSIAMPGGTESLNAAVSAAIVMYERMRRTQS